MGELLLPSKISQDSMALVSVRRHLFALISLLAVAVGASLFGTTRLWSRPSPLTSARNDPIQPRVDPATYSAGFSSHRQDVSPELQYTKSVGAPPGLQANDTSAVGTTCFVANVSCAGASSLDDRLDCQSTVMEDTALRRQGAVPPTHYHSYNVDGVWLLLSVVLLRLLL